MVIDRIKPVAQAAAAAVLVVLLSWPPLFETVEGLAYDFTQRLAGHVEPESGVLIVAIDEESLDRIGAWPWPRDILADLVRSVSAGSPAAIGVDLLLDDPAAPDSDRALADAVASAGVAVLAVRVDGPAGGEVWRMPLPIFQDGARGLGHVHADPGLNNVMRSIVTAKQAEGTVRSAFAVEVLKAAGRLPAGFEQDLGGMVRIVPEEVRIRFAGDRGTFPAVPAWEVLEGRVDASRFEDRMVLVGVTAEGLGDDWMTPMSVSGRTMSGVEIHANTLDSLYSGRSVGEVPEWIVFLALTGLFLALRWIDGRFEGFRFYAAALLTLPALVAVSWFLMERSLWLPFPTFFLGVVLVVPALAVRKVVTLNRSLDEKVARLSDWGYEPEAPAPSSVPPAPARDLDAALQRRWIEVLARHADEGGKHRDRRERLLARRRRDAAWKLDAVEFSNEQLHRFVVFNEAVLAGIDDVIVVGDPAGRVVYQNPAARGLARFSDRPPPLWDYLSSLLDGRPLVEPVVRAIAEDETGRVESVPDSTGSRWFTVTLGPIVGLGVVASLHDVTAQRELDQAKNDMVSLVSHELRTPLTSIRGYADMLAKYGLVEDTGREFLASILAESTRLNDLIQSFLDVAAVESGRRPLDATEFEVAPLAGDLLTSLAPVAERKRIVLENAVGSGAGTVRADRALVYQAVANLVSNAIKYSPEGTRVRVELEADAGMACFRVRDQGCGIPPEDAQRIFEKFYRRANAETRAETGFGLGLPFVRQVAEQHGGSVDVESVIGEGSVFSFRIPAPGPEARVRTAT